MEGLTMMNSEKYYKSLTEKELRLLIKHNNDKALEEFLRRKDTGEIPRNWMTIEEFVEKYNKKAS